MKTKILKKIIFSIVCASFGVITLLPTIAGAASIGTQAPSYDTDFQKYLTNGGNGVYNANSRFQISATKSIKDNITTLFSPNNPQSILWVFIKNIMIGITILFIVRAGIDFLLNANNPAKLKSAIMSLLYILIGGFLVYAAVRIMGSILTIQGGNPADELTYNLTQKIFLTVLSFLKAGAFFLAIVMAAVYGYQMISAMDKDDRALKARKGIINIILALIFMKVIDFIYFIAQEHNFGSRLQTLLLSAAKVIGWAMGGIMVGVLIYAGFRYISAQGDETKAKNAQKMITKIFYAVLIVFMFLLVTRQIIDAFAK